MRYHFKHNFQDSLNLLCNCRLNTESTSDYLRHCLLFAHERKIFLSNIKNISHKFLEQNDPAIRHPLQKLIHSFSIQQFNMFYLVKYLRKLSCEENHENHFPRFLPFIFIIAIIHSHFLIFILIIYYLLLLLLLFLVTLNETLATCVFN